MTWTIHHGDALDVLRTLPHGLARCAVTSPPYWGLRNYGEAGQMGLERTPEEYVERMVAVMRELRRVLTDDGTLWLNLGDSYAGSWGNQGRKGSRGTQRPINGEMLQNVGQVVHDATCMLDEDCQCGALAEGIYPQRRNTGSWVNGHQTLKPKDLVGIPWRVAFALQADGWYLRSDIIWAKPNPMPESVTDRPTKAHEYLFLLSKAPRYFYDTDAIREPSITGDVRKPYGVGQVDVRGNGHDRNGGVVTDRHGSVRNRRSVWTIPTAAFPDAHFATFPEALVEPCILAGSARGDIVMDPFCGTGTVGVVALRHSRRFAGIDLSDKYIAMARRRIEGDAPLFNVGARP